MIVSGEIVCNHVDDNSGCGLEDHIGDDIPLARLVVNVAENRNLNFDFEAPKVYATKNKYGLKFIKKQVR